MPRADFARGKELLEENMWKGLSNSHPYQLQHMFSMQNMQMEDYTFVLTIKV